ncbi:porin [Xylophilus rhododendri]|uniref:Porin n=1 Tax=Xylophilus rhododendri TaxID=2697032 RepID=A0A857JA34_9BURK|nr:porin [Xylophilus rhododendri]QHI99605.1 porin [Xylophilus rhododendri]
MKKSLIAACVGLACVSGAHAQSNVTLTGLVDLYVASQKRPGDSGRTNVLDSGGMTTSWFGMTGTEDLGGGLKANFKLTSFQRVDTGTPGRFTGDNFFTRDANVGLSGSFGAVTLGRGLAPNFLPTILFNPFGDSFNFSPLVLHKNVGLFNGTNWPASTPADTGWSNEIIYTTPDLGGLTVNLHYQFGEQNSSTNNDNRKNVGINALYFNGPFALTGYYEYDQVNNYNATNGSLITTGTALDTKKDWLLGGTYDAGVVKGFLTYSQTKADVSTLEFKTTQVGASAPIGAGKLLASVASTKIDNATATIPGKRLTATVGYDYFLSKRTDVYANLMYDKLTGNYTKGNSVAVGIRHRF